MKILSINIIEFAGLCGVKHDFADGVNVVEGLNESGKSTINSFIKFMLYGLSKSKTSESSMSEREYYTSWKNGVAEGTMTVEFEGRIYRIERRGVMIATYKDTCTVFDVVTGEKVFKGREPGEVFLGVSAQVYESTCCIRQRELSDIDGKGVSEAIRNMLVSADKNVNVDRAQKKLVDLRKYLKLQRGDGGRISELEREIEHLTLRLEKAERCNLELRRQRALAESKRKTTDQLREQLKEAEARLRAFDAYKTLEKFKALHGIEERIVMLSKEISELDVIYGWEGEIPTRSTVDELMALERAIPSAALEKERAEAALIQSRNIPRQDSLKLRSAEKISEMGGRDTVVNAFTRLIKKSKAFVGLSVALFISAAIFSAIGVALGILLSPVLYAVSGLGAVSLALAIVFLALKKKNTSSIRGFLGSIGYFDGKIPPIFSLEAYIIDCIKCSSEEMRRQQLVAHSEALLEERNEELERVLQKGRRALGAYCDPPEATASCANGYTELLREIISRIIDYCKKKDSLAADLSVEKRVRETMRQALVGIDEELLRARVPENADAIFASQSREVLDRSRGYLSQQIVGCDRQREEAEKRLIELESTTEDPATLISAIEEKKIELDRLRVSYDAVMLAMESIESAGISLRAGVTPRLCDGASKRMERLTDGKYKGLSVDSDIKLSVMSDMTRDIAVLSCGTRDAAYLSLRFSMIEMLFGKDMPCITIDEGLSQLDDIRARSMLSVLDGYCEDGGQCIIFTCHSREATLLEADEIKYNRIILN